MVHVCTIGSREMSEISQSGGRWVLPMIGPLHRQLAQRIAADVKPLPYTSTKKTALEMATGTSAAWSGPMTRPSFECSHMAAMMTWVSPGSTIGIYLVELHRRACEAIGCRLAGAVEPLVGAAVQEDLDPVDVEQVGELDAYLEQSLAGGHGKKVAGDRRSA